MWVNSTNLFDAASGFGGYRESGFGREGGREGLFEYVRTPEPPRGAARAPRQAAARAAARRRLRPPADRPHRQALHRRQAGAAGLRLQPEGARPEGARDRRGGGGQPQGPPQRRRGRPRRGGLGEPDRAQPRPGRLLHRREPRRPRRGVGGAPRADDRGRGGGEGRGRRHDRAPLLLRGVGRQVRRRRPPHAAAQRDAGHARGGRHDRRRVPGRGPAPGLRHPGRLRHRHGQHRDRRPLRAPPARGDRLLPGARDERRARRAS